MNTFIPRVRSVKDKFSFFLIFYWKCETKLSKNNEARPYKNPTNSVAVLLWLGVPKWNITTPNVKMKAKLKSVLEI